MNLLSNKTINSTRQIELDVAKAIAIIFMVIVHINEVYMSPKYEGGTYNQIVEFLGSPPAAPIFMFLLGLGIVYSRRSSFDYLLKRGFFILALGYLLNFFRDYIPYTILAIRDSDISCKNEAINCLFGIDILPFAGLAFIFFAYIKKYKIKVQYLPLFWLFFSAINLILRDKSTGNYALDALLGLIWGTTDYSWFPFLSWIFFPILGYVFGSILIFVNNKSKFYKICMIYSLGILIPLYIFAYINQIHFGGFGELYQETYYHHDIIGNLIMGAFAVFWISIIFFITPYIPNTIIKPCMRWSKNLNLIYCVHWIILGYSMLILQMESYDPLIILLISLVIFIISDFISYKISNFKNKHKTSKDSLAA